MQQSYYNGSYYQPPINNDSEQLERYALQKKEKSELIKTGAVIGGAIMGYLIIQTVITAIVLKGDIKALFDSSPLFQNCFSMLTVHFASVLVPFSVMALILKKQFVAPLVPMRKNRASKTFIWVCFGMGMCVLANYATSFVITICEQLGYELTQTEMLKPNDTLSCISALLATAVVPPIFEEFALRCCTLGALRKYGKGFAVFTVSVVFGLLHGNVIQFLFAFMIGLVLGYTTIRTESIVPAILIHAFNNGMSVVNDLVSYAVNEKAAKTAIVALYCMWLVLGIVGVITLIVKKELVPKKEEREPKNPNALPFLTRIACLLPGFALPFIMLIVITITTIHKI